MNRITFRGRAFHEVPNPCWERCSPKLNQYTYILQSDTPSVEVTSTEEAFHRGPTEMSDNPPNIGEMFLLKI